MDAEQERLIESSIEIRSAEDSSAGDGLCSICLVCKLQCLSDWCEHGNTLATVIHCGHVFHAECLRRWFRSDNHNHNKCPYCRSEVFRSKFATSRSLIIHPWNARNHGWGTNSTSSHSNARRSADSGVDDMLRVLHGPRRSPSPLNTFGLGNSMRLPLAELGMTLRSRLPASLLPDPQTGTYTSVQARWRQQTTQRIRNNFPSWTNEEVRVHVRSEWEARTRFLRDLEDLETLEARQSNQLLESSREIQTLIDRLMPRAPRAITDRLIRLLVHAIERRFPRLAAEVRSFPLLDPVREIGQLNDMLLRFGPLFQAIPSPEAGELQLRQFRLYHFVESGVFRAYAPELIRNDDIMWIRLRESHANAQSRIPRTRPTRRRAQRTPDLQANAPASFLIGSSGHSSVLRLIQDRDSEGGPATEAEEQ